MDGSIPERPTPVSPASLSLPGPMLYRASPLFNVLSGPLLHPYLLDWCRQQQELDHTVLNEELQWELPAGDAWGQKG